MIKGYVYLTIELEARELASKSLLAARLIEQGYAVIIGQQWAIFSALEQLPRGAILFKGYHKIFWPAMARAKKLGFAVFAHDEELFIQVHAESFKEIVKGFDEGMVDCIFATGPKEQQHLLGAGINRVMPTGNPRLELLGEVGQLYFAKEVEAIRAEFGEFVLINTNFGSINSLWGSQEQAMSAARQAGLTDSLSEFMATTVARETFAWDFIRDFINSDAKSQFVIRPHPSEDLAPWSREFSGHPRVHVVRRGHHAPWTMSASALIHSGCLTGLEAALLGVPAFNILKPGGRAIYADWAPDELAISASTVEDLRALMCSDSGQADVRRRILSLTFGHGDSLPPSAVMGHQLAMAATERCPKSPTSWPATTFGAPVVQLERKCQISAETMAGAMQRACFALDLGSTPAITELNLSLFLITPEALPLEKENRWSTLREAKNVAATAASRVDALEGLWEKTGSPDCGLQFAERLWALGRHGDAVAILETLRQRRMGGAGVLATLGARLSYLGFARSAAMVFAEGRALFPKDAQFAIGFGKACLASAPHVTEAEFRNALAIAGSDLLKRCRVFRDGIEYAGFARRLTMGEAPYHVSDLAEVGFRDVAAHAREFRDAARALWESGKHRNAETFELVALSQFAAGGVDKLAQFLPTFHQNAGASVWPSVRHWADHPHWYEPPAGALPGADKTRSHAGGGDIFESMPMLSCDAVYLQRFGAQMIKSLKAVGYNGGVALHLMAVRDEEAEAAQKFLEQLGMPYILVVEDVSGIEKTARRVYFHMARFFRMHELLGRLQLPIWLMDVDALFRNDPALMMRGLAGRDVAFRARACRLHPWNQINASVFGVAATERGVDYLSKVANYLAKAWQAGFARWGADQVAMFMILRRLESFGAPPNLVLLGPTEVDYEHSDDGVVWQNSGIGKFGDRGALAKQLGEMSLSSRFDGYAQTVR